MINTWKLDAICSSCNEEGSCGNCSAATMHKRSKSDLFMHSVLEEKDMDTETSTR